MEQKNRITIVCGHYGCGKTNLALNIALETAQKRKPCTVMDMDVVNPYFRSSEYGELLKGAGIELVAPVFANTTLDTPTLPPEIYSAFSSQGREIIIDAGGDDAGITALGGISDEIAKNGYEMLYVINMYRVLSQTPGEAAELLGEIERASHLKATGLVNNSHLGTESTEKTVSASLDFANEVSRLTGLPLLYSTIPAFAAGAKAAEGLKVIKRLVLFPWEKEIPGAR